jgi:hypothetical protein
MAPSLGGAFPALIGLEGEKEKKKKGRPDADLPSCFDCITEDNIFECCDVTDEYVLDKKTGESTGPFKVAQTVKCMDPITKEPVMIVIDKLTVDQIRLLLKVLCIRGYASATKFRCRQLLGVHVALRGVSNLDTNPNSTSVVEKKPNSELCKIQAFFHPEHFEDMMKVNALKGRVDHENGTSKKVVWSTLADMYNSVDPDKGIDQLDFTCTGDKYKHRIGEPEFLRAVLSNFATTPSGGLELKCYFFGLFKLHRQMKYLIGESSTHCNDPLSYVDHAKTTTKEAVAHRLAPYYFYVKCEENPRVVDTEFVTSMPNQFKGSSDEEMEIYGKDISPLTEAKTATSTKEMKMTAAKKEDMLQSCVGAFQSIAEGLVANAALAQEANTTNTCLELLKSNTFSPTTSARIKLALLHAAKMDVPLTPAYVAPIVHLPAKKQTIAETLVNSDDKSDDDSGNEMTIDDLSKNLLELHYLSKNLLESSDNEEDIYS